MDLADYIQDGIVGKINTTITNIYDHDWAHHWTTNHACTDAHQRSITEFVVSCYACFVDSNDENVPATSVGISDAGKIKFCEAVNNVADKFINYFISSKIFFNALQTYSVDPELNNKYTEIITYNYRLLYLNPELWGVFIGFVNGVLTPITVDYASNQTLNEQIYKNLITSLADFQHAIKNMIKVLTGSVFEEVKVT